MRTRRLIVGFVPLATLLLTVGCSDEHAGKYEVSGAVKLKGQPIPDGASVMFEPLENQGTRFTTMTSGGGYKVSRQNGLKTGKYLVRVSHGDGKTPVNPVDANAPPGPTGNKNIVSKDLVPSDWNVNSKQERTVVADKPNVFDLEIP